jgi:hypothetical protein
VSVVVVVTCEGEEGDTDRGTDGDGDKDGDKDGVMNTERGWWRGEDKATARRRRPWCY